MAAEVIARRSPMLCGENPRLAKIGTTNGRSPPVAAPVARYGPAKFPHPRRYDLNQGSPTGPWRATGGPGESEIEAAHEVIADSEARKGCGQRRSLTQTGRSAHGAKASAARRARRPRRPRHRRPWPRARRHRQRSVRFGSGQRHGANALPTGSARRRGVPPDHRECRSNSCSN